MVEITFAFILQITIIIQTSKMPRHISLLDMFVQNRSFQKL